MFWIIVSVLMVVATVVAALTLSRRSPKRVGASYPQIDLGKEVIYRTRHGEKIGFAEEFLRGGRQLRIAVVARDGGIRFIRRRADRCRPPIHLLWQN